MRAGPHQSQHRRISRYVIWMIFPLLVGLTPGCANKPDHPAVFPVTGQVLYGGKPVEGAAVSFVGDGTARPAYGSTDAEGKFRLTTFDQGDGAIAGKHHVSVSRSVNTADPADDGSMEAAEKRANQPRVAPKSAIPERYADWNRSDLDFTVSASGANDFKIELKD